LEISIEDVRRLGQGVKCCLRNKLFGIKKSRSEDFKQKHSFESRPSCQSYNCDESADCCNSISGESKDRQTVLQIPVFGWFPTFPSKASDSTNIQRKEAASQSKPFQAIDDRIFLIKLPLNAPKSGQPHTKTSATSFANRKKSNSIL
jgi:hypothetical protein